MTPAAGIAYLGTLTMYGKGSLPVGAIPAGRRRLDYAKGGRLEGPALKADLLGGHDALLQRLDGSLLADVRLALRLDDGVGLELCYRGYMTGAPGIGDKVFARADLGDEAYSIRTHVWFETGSEKYAWLNTTIAFGQGRFDRDGEGKPAMIYDYFRVL